MRCRLYVSLVAMSVLTGCGGDDPATGAPSSAGEAGAPTAATAPESEPAVLPALDEGQYECDGTWNGERFWLRLGPPNPTFGGRLLQVVYTPPPPTALDGTFLDPHPWLLLDADLLLIGWNERSRMSRAQYDAEAEPPGYRVVHEVEQTIGDERFPRQRERFRPGERAWDLRLAPALLALVWRADTRGRVPLIDLFATDDTRTVLSWDDRDVRIGPDRYHVQGDAEGRLQRLLDADRVPVLSVRSREPVVPAAEARAREAAMLERFTVD